MKDDKYITIKREDFEQWKEKFKQNYHMRDEFLPMLERAALSDTVVVRLKDTFAGAALHTYANSIAVSARVLGELAPSTRDRLQDVADYFHTAAVRADEIAAAGQSKLPD